MYAGWAYSLRAGLIGEAATAPIDAAVRRRIVVAQALYAFGAALCLISPIVSIGFIVLVQLNFAVAPRIPFLSRI